jgi:hypothetical protein
MTAPQLHGAEERHLRSAAEQRRRDRHAKALRTKRTAWRAYQRDQKVYHANLEEYQQIVATREETGIPYRDLMRRSRAVQKLGRALHRSYKRQDVTEKRAWFAYCAYHRINYPVLAWLSGGWFKKRSAA